MNHGGLSRRGLIVSAGALALTACGREKALPPMPATHKDLFLSDLEARHGGRIGIAALDMQSGNRTVWRGHDRFAFCSTFKPFLSLATLQRIEREEEWMDRRIAIKASDIVPHAPITGPLVGSSMTIGELMQASVQFSDNPATNILIRELGGIAVWRKWWPTIGDTMTLVSRLEPDLNSALPIDTRDTCLPEQMLANLHLMAFGNLLQSDHEVMIETWMQDSTGGEARLKAAAPEGWTVAHKSGTGGYGTTNDIGILTPVTGAPVVMAVYYTGAEAALPEQRDAIVAESARRALEVLGRV